MSKDFFLENLNYSMANEDSTLEQSIALDQKSSKILSVCGSGSRVFPLVTQYATELDIIDMSSIQLDFAKLREKTFQQLNYKQFLEFWGYQTLAGNLRKKNYEFRIRKLGKKVRGFNK